MKQLRAGVVGLGHRGRDMFSLVSDNFDCVIPAAACDVLPRNWTEKDWRTNKSMAEKYPETEFYESYDEMLEKANLDFVLVETGADIHADFCLKALEKNINVLTDIPVVANLDEADRLWKAHQNSEAMISVGANPNYQKFTYMLKEFYEKGLLGKPFCMEAEYLHWDLPGSEWAKELVKNGDWRNLLAPVRYCTHSLGPLLTILEEELREVSCFGTGKHSEESIKSDDMMCAQYRTDSGVVVRFLRNGRIRSQIGHHNYRVFGTEGYIERIDRFNKPVIRYNSMKELDTSLKEVTGEFMPREYARNEKALNSGHGGMDFAMVDCFLNALLNGEEAPVTLKEGLAMTLPGIYAEESAKRGGEVLRMRYPWDDDWTTVIK